MLTTKKRGQKRALALLLTFALVVTGCFGTMGPAVAQAASTLVTETPLVSVTGQGVIAGGTYTVDNVGMEKSYTLNDLKTIAASNATDQYSYSARKSQDPYTRSLYLGEGVRLDTLLAESGVSGPALSDNVISAIDNSGATPWIAKFDPSRTTFGTDADKAAAQTTQAFSATRYYYPNALATTPSEDGATVVPTILAWANTKSTTEQPTTAAPTSSLYLLTGQLGLADYNNSLYNKNTNSIQVGDAITGTALTVGSTDYTRAQVLMMPRATNSYSYTKSTGAGVTDVARGVPISVLLASYNDDDVVTFTTADGYPVAATGKTKAELVDEDYMIAYEKGTSSSTLAGICNLNGTTPELFTLYGNPADADGKKPAKMITGIAVTPATGPDFANSPYKHITNGGITSQSGPYDIDAITSATLTVEGPGVEASVPLSVRTVEEQNAGESRGVYTDQVAGQPNTKSYEGVKLSYILNSMPDVSKVTLTDNASTVVIKNRARQTIASFSMAQITEADNAKKPILVSYGVGTEDESVAAPFVYDLGQGSIPSLNNEDGCLKLVYDKGSITGDTNTSYTTFGNMAYIYVEEGASPGYKHVTSPYNDPQNTQFLMSLKGTGIGREINLSVAQLEALAVDDSAGANTLGDYTSTNIGLRKAYSLTNTSYWSVNEYEGLKLYNLLARFKSDIKADDTNAQPDSTPVKFAAWDGYLSNESFTLGDLRNPDTFGFYEKNALDLGDGTYTPVPGDLKDSGYPVMIAYGVNEYPYVKTPSDLGYANGLNNSGGPLRVIYGKRDYNTNNGSNQVQKLQSVVVGDDTYQYSTHKYSDKSVYTDMASNPSNDLQVVVKGANGDVLKDQTYTLGELEDLIYGSGVSKIQAGLADSKGTFGVVKTVEPYTVYNDVYEGLNLNYFIKNLLEVPGVKGTVTFSDGTNTTPVTLERLLALGSNPDTDVTDLSSTLAFAKNGTPLVLDKNTAGYESTFTLSDGATTFPIKNAGGPLQLLIPSTTGTEIPSNAISMSNVKSITIDLQTDSYTHSNPPYSDLSDNTVTVSGAGTYLSAPKDFTVSELEGKQTLADTADYNIKDATGESQTRYRGLNLYDFLKSSAVGLRLNADKVKITGEDGTVVEMSIADIMRNDLINGQNNTIDNLGTMLAFGSASVSNTDLEDGLPLVLDSSAEGYDAIYQNAGGPIKLVTGQTDATDENAGRTVTNVKSIEITASATVAQNHSVSDVYKTYLNDTFTIRVQNSDNSSSFTKTYTVGELEAMTDLIVNDEFTWVGVQQHEGLKLWDLIKKADPSISDDTALSSVNVYDNGGSYFSKDVLSIFGKEALINGIADSGDPDLLKPIILAYSENGLPLVASATSDGYSETAGNLGGPLRLITHENQGACVRNTDGVTVVLSGTGTVDDPTEDLTLTVDGKVMTFAASELKAMTPTTLNYAVKSATPNKTAKGVLLYDLLKAQGVTNPDALITFKTPDNFQDSSKAKGYKDITLRDIKAQKYLVAYSGALGADADEASLTDFNDLVKNTAATYTKLRVYRNYTTSASDWYNEMSNITGIDGKDYAIAIKTDTTTLRLTLDDLKAMKATTDTYQVKGVEKTVTGALLSDILTVMGVNKPQTTISLLTFDDYSNPTYTTIPLSDIKGQDYLIAYQQDSTPIADTLKSDSSVITHVRVYRHCTTNTAEWYNEAKAVVTISASNTQYNFIEWPNTTLSGIRSIQSNFNGGYWVGTYGGGLMKRSSDGTTTIYNLESTPALDTTFVSAVAPDKAGGVWFSQNASYINPGDNKGLIYMNAAGELTKYTVESNPGTIPDNYVQALYLDSGSLADTSDDILWIGTFGGLTKYEIGTDTWTTYAKTGDNPAGFPATSVTSITPAGDGNLWVGFYPDSTGTGVDGTYNGGCIKFNTTTGAADPDFTQTYTAPYDPLISTARLADAWVRSIAVDSNGGAYIVRAGSTIGLLGTVGGHVDYVAPDGTVTSYTGNDLLGTMLTGSSEIRTVAIDGSGNLWFGTSANGVAYCTPPTGGTSGTVLKIFNSAKGDWTLTNPTLGSSTYDNVYTITINGDNILVGSAGGVSTITKTAALSEPEPSVLTVYDHDAVKAEFTTDLLNSMAALAGGKLYNYSAYNTYPTWKHSDNAQGPTVDSILAQAGIDLDSLAGNTLISFVANQDNFTVRFTADQLRATRCYYPNGATGTANGEVGGSEALAGKVEVPAIINMLGGKGTLSFGQVLPNEQNWSDFNQMMADGGTGKIIIGDAAPTWNSVTVAGTKADGTVTAIASGSTVTVGTVIDFVKPNGAANKSGKIYYTLDGTDPTMASNFYNYNEYSSPNDITKSITLNQTGDITIKTIVIGRGEQDSGITTFIYHVVLPATTGLKAVGTSSSSVDLSWDSVKDATGYNVYRGLTKDTATECIAQDITGNTWHDTNLSSNKKYYYVVTANAGDVEGLKTAAVGCYTKLTATSLTAAATGFNSVKLSWNPISGAEGYYIYRYNATTKTYDYLTKTSGTTFTNASSALISGQTYSYEVCGYRLDGTAVVLGELSKAASAKPIPAAPSSFVAVSAGYNSVKTAWSSVPGATGYYVYRYNGTTKSYAYIGQTTSTSYTNTSSQLTAGKTYQYKVKAYRLVGTTKVAGVASAAKAVTPIPSAPTIALAKASSTSIKISWSGVPGATYYQIYRKTGTGGTWIYVGKTKYSTSRSWTNINLTPGKTYYYKVRACRVVGSTVVKGAFSTVLGKKI